MINHWNHYLQNNNKKIKRKLQMITDQRGNYAYQPNS